MTTLLIDIKKNKIYADTQISVENIKYKQDKVLNINKNILLACSGSYTLFIELYHFIKNNNYYYNELNKINENTDENIINNLINNLLKDFKIKEYQEKDLDSEIFILTFNKLFIINNYVCNYFDNDYEDEDFYFSGSGGTYAKTILNTINIMYPLILNNNLKQEDIKELFILECLKNISKIDIYTNNNFKCYKIYTKSINEKINDLINLNKYEDKNDEN